jgi:hypothetical protein
MKPLQEAAATGVGVVVVVHDRKSGGEVGDSARGSSAIVGAADVVLRLRRVDGQNQNLRKLEALSRFDATPPSQVIELTDGGYVSHGSETAAAEDQATEAVRAILPTDEERAKSVEELLLVLQGQGIRKSSLRSALEGLVEKGTAHRKGKGSRGHAFRYWAVAVEIRPVRPISGVLNVNESAKPEAEPVSLDLEPGSTG